MTSLIVGWLVWSFGHYWGHRWFHWRMKRGSRAGVIEGEYLHHEHYDTYPPKPDPGGRHATFPYSILLAINLAYVAIAWYFFGPATALLFCFGLNGAMAVDDFVHFLDHGSIWKSNRHRLHHSTHACNYAFWTGVIWDVIFRTYRNDRRNADEETAGLPSPSRRGTTDRP
jgi:sterol desaturase/sphingolipid hydroxylase (fatty acid hydroxylase superfamily)